MRKADLRAQGNYWAARALKAEAQRDRALEQLAARDRCCTYVSVSPWGTKFRCGLPDDHSEEHHMFPVQGHA